MKAMVLVIALLFGATTHADYVFDLAGLITDLDATIEEAAKEADRVTSPELDLLKAKREKEIKEIVKSLAGGRR